MTFTKAEVAALRVLAKHDWVDGSNITRESDIYPTVRTSTVRRLIKKGVAKARAQIGGRPITGADLARFLGFWEEYFAITPKGRRALKEVVS